VFANFGKAIAAYERKLVSVNFAPSPFDAFLAGDHEAMTPAAIRGAKLFVGKAACDECHRGTAFTDHKFHNIGAPQYGQYVLATDEGRYDGIAALNHNVFWRGGVFSDSPDGATTLAETNADIGAFKTPTLRNVAKTAPYMHDGVYTTLWDVVNHYNFGGGTGAFAGTKEITLAPLLLEDRELEDLVEFLRALSDGAPHASEDFPEGLVALPTLP
jgi:cytochrome c peroxidase